MFKKKIDLRMIDPTSKMALKMSCLQTTGGDVKKAQELYAFLAEGVESMPDYPVQKPSTMQQLQQAAGNIFGWVKENQGDLAKAYNFIQQLRGGKPIPMPTAPASVPAATPPVDIPPLPQMQ